MTAGIFHTVCPHDCPSVCALEVEKTEHGRLGKVKIVKFNRRKHHRKETGHRQWYTEVKITGISA